MQEAPVSPKGISKDAQRCAPGRVLPRAACRGPRSAQVWYAGRRLPRAAAARLPDRRRQDPRPRLRAASEGRPAAPRPPASQRPPQHPARHAGTQTSTPPPPPLAPPVFGPQACRGLQAPRGTRQGHAAGPPGRHRPRVSAPQPATAARGAGPPPVGAAPAGSRAPRAGGGPVAQRARRPTAPPPAPARSLNAAGTRRRREARARATGAAWRTRSSERARPPAAPELPDRPALPARSACPARPAACAARACNDGICQRTHSLRPVAGRAIPSHPLSRSLTLHLPPPLPPACPPPAAQPGRAGGGAGGGGGPGLGDPPRLCGRREGGWAGGPGCVVAARAGLRACVLRRAAGCPLACGVGLASHRHTAIYTSNHFLAARPSRS